jgi:hypothetical protein
MSKAKKCSVRLWKATAPQAVTSAATSINDKKLPTVFSRASFVPGGINADIGGGRFDNAVAALRKQGVENVIFDPYNRTKEHNAVAAERICGGQSDTATISNVLNVIQEPEARRFVLRQAADAVRKDGTVFIGIYEGDRKGQGRTTSKGWQENRKTADYLDEVRRVFGEVKVERGIIVAKRPKKR